MSTRQVCGPVIRGRISPAAVWIENSSLSVQRRRRYMIASRAPLPDSSASVPSGLKILRSATCAGILRAGELEHTVGEHAEVTLAEPPHSCRRELERQLLALEDQIVVSQCLPLLESHLASLRAWSLLVGLTAPESRRISLGDIARVAHGDVDHAHARELPHPRQLALCVVARAPLHCLHVPAQQLLEAECLARGLRRPGRIGPAHLLGGPRREHRIDAGVDPLVQHLPLHRQSREQGRMAQLLAPQLRWSLGRLELSLLQQLQRAHDPLAVVRVDPLRRPRSAPSERRMQRGSAIS